MSERSPEQQPHPRELNDTCDSCNKKYRITPSNSGIMHHEKQPECDYLICKCPHCKGITRIFCDQETVQSARDNGIKQKNEMYAPQEIYQSWLNLHGIELAKNHTLTARQEEIVRKFGQSLLKIPDDLLIDGFNSEHNKPYPQRWA